MSCAVLSKQEKEISLSTYILSDHWSPSLIRTVVYMYGKRILHGTELNDNWVEGEWAAYRASSARTEGITVIMRDAVAKAE